MDVRGIRVELSCYRVNFEHRAPQPRIPFRCSGVPRTPNSRLRGGRIFRKFSIKFMKFCETFTKFCEFLLAILLNFH